MLPAMVAVVSACHIGRYLKGNTKRLAMTAMTFFLFAAYSSFSFPIFMNEEMQDMTNGYDLEGDPDAIALADQNEVNPEALEWLEDEDVLEDFVDAEHHEIQNADKYALDEILESNTGLLDDKDKKTMGEADYEMSFSRDDWRLVLINKQHPIPEGYTFNLGTIKGNMRCDERIINDLLDMMQAAKDDGINLVICSPYRDMERQEMLFARKINRYMKKGMTYMDAYKLTSQAVTVPGASEHQIGLALDIVSDVYSALDEGFGETEAGKWLVNNSARFGFILRYPEGKEYITGIEYEPWHFRYVGSEAAIVIMEKNITLEEFWEDIS